jgi:universal stress protein E
MERFQRILFVADTRAASQATFKRAVALAKENRARLTVVDVIEDLPRDAQMLVTMMPPKDLQDLVIQERRRRIEKLIHPIQAQGVRATAKVLYGTPFLEIVREVLRNQHDLVMMTAEGQSELKEILFGSTTMHLMRKCPCPVWVMKRSRQRKFARILAAVDPAPTDQEKNALNIKIMDLAVSLAQSERSQLHIIHTWTLYGEDVLRAQGRLPRRELTKFAQTTGETHKGWLDELLGKYPLGELSHHIHLLKGEAWLAIPEVAKKEKIDLIVMGTVCRTGVTGFLIGNTAEKVLRQVDCSVLTVKPDGFVTPVSLDES